LESFGPRGISLANVPNQPERRCIQVTDKSEIDALNRIATTLEKMYNTAEIALWTKDSTNAQAYGESHALIPYNEPPTPTSKLLSDAAKLIHDLMIERGVDCQNGWRWQDFERELRDRAWAFKQCEDEGKL
jgi:hypothetical protein